MVSYFLEIIPSLLVELFSLFTRDCECWFDKNICYQSISNYAKKTVIAFATHVTRLLIYEFISFCDILQMSNCFDLLQPVNKTFCLVIYQCSWRSRYPDYYNLKGCSKKVKKPLQDTSHIHDCQNSRRIAFIIHN